MRRVLILLDDWTGEAKLRLRLIKRTLRIVWDAAGSWTVAWTVLLIVNGVVPAALVYLTKFLVDSLASVIEAGASWETASVVLGPALLMVGLVVVQRVLGSLTSWVGTAQSELVGDYVKEMIHRKSAAVEYGFYESPEYFDRLQQANSQASGRTLTLLRNLGTLLQSSVTFVSIGVVLAQYSVFVPLLLVLSTLPALYVVVRYNRFYHDWWKETTEKQRLANYFDAVLTTHAMAAEVRLLSLSAPFRKLYQALRERLREERIDIAKRQAIATLGATAIGLVVTGAAMVWMVWRALRGLATLGDLALFYQAFNQGQGLMRGLLSGAGQIYTDTLFLQHLFMFLDQGEEEEAPPGALPMPGGLHQGIEFEDVTFTYPGGSTPALDQFDIKIPAGKVVAVVGANGAGKSTLIKLLCRLYDPDEGQVTIDGVDLRQYSREELRENVSVLFQHPVRYQATAAENISMGEEDVPLEDVERASRHGGSHDFINRLPKRYDTKFGRLFEGGTELSGGEWQRVALSRAFLRPAPIVVLDEPTTYMDSWTEIEWMQRFRSLVKGRTALIITHRFTTAMQADLIYVMMEGQVTEMGTHKELLRLGGHYAESWWAQMQVEGEPVATGAPGSSLVDDGV